jgi:hypothetical protein
MSRPWACTYCGRTLLSEVPKWATIAYHGRCRIDHLRNLYRSAISDAERERITQEVAAIKAHMPTDAIGVQGDQ